MAALYWIVKVYKWWLIVWVLMTWIPGIAGSTLHQIVGIPIEPVLAPLSFLTLGPIGLAPIVPLIILNYLEPWLGKKAGLIAEETPEQPDGVVDVRDLQPATPPAATPDNRPSGTGI